MQSRDTLASHSRAPGLQSIFGSVFYAKPTLKIITKTLETFKLSGNLEIGRNLVKNNLKIQNLGPSMITREPLGSHLWLVTESCLAAQLQFHLPTDCPVLSGRLIFIFFLSFFAVREKKNLSNVADTSSTSFLLVKPTR